MLETETTLENIAYPNRYVIDHKSKSYVFLFADHPAVGQNIILPEQFVSNLVLLYSAKAGYGWTVNQIATYFETSPELIKAILQTVGTTHADVISKVELQRLFEDEGHTPQTVDKVVADAGAIARFKANISKSITQQDRKDAEKWRALKEGLVDPFADAIQELKPLKHSPIRRRLLANDQRLPTAVVCLSDIHFGDVLDPNQVFNGQAFTLETLETRLDEYADWVVAKVAAGQFNSNECHVLALGDLIDSLSGFTDKGTQLIPNRERGHQLFKSALLAFVRFFNRLADAFDRVVTYAVGGNHDFKADLNVIYAAYLTLHAAGKADIDTDLIISEQRLNSTLIRNTYILFEHGYSSKYNHKVPKGGPARQAYILGHIMSDPLATTGNCPRVFVCGDQHHQETVEYKGFDFVKSGALVSTNHYAAESGFGSVPSQTVLGITEQGMVVRHSFIPSDWK